jgi:hypothetical protein
MNLPTWFFPETLVFGSGRAWSPVSSSLQRESNENWEKMGSSMACECGFSFETSDAFPRRIGELFHNSLGGEKGHRVINGHLIMRVPFTN